MSGGEEAVPHPPPPSLPGSHEEEEGSSPSKMEPCLNHLKNDSGSYDGGSELLKTSSSDKEGLTNISNGRPPTILISNGEGRGEEEGEGEGDNTRPLVMVCH